MIDNQKEFDEWIVSFNPTKYVAIDTEFVKQKTFFPMLSLLQIHYEGKTVILDPLKVDIKPAIEKIANSELLKIFHSARQDLEALYYRYGILLEPIFDTQIAATFLGFRDHISYGELVEYFIGEQIDKTHQFIDWSARPLTKAVLDYAADDVRYLVEIFYKMHEVLVQKESYDWVLEVCSDIKNWVLDDGQYYFDYKMFSLDVKFLDLLKAMTIWRETYCKKNNINRNKLLSNMDLHLIKPHIKFEDFLVTNPNRKVIYEGYAEFKDLDSVFQPTVSERQIYKEVLNIIKKEARRQRLPVRYFLNPAHVFYEGKDYLSKKALQFLIRRKSCML